MRGLYFVALFPVLSGVGFTLIQAALSLRPRAYSPDLVVRFAGWIHLAFLLVPLSVVVTEAQSAGALWAIGVRWPELPMMPAAAATIVVGAAAALIGAALYYNELLISLALRSFVTPAIGSSIAASIMEGRSSTLRTLTPGFADFMTCATLVAGVEEFLWRGYLISVLTTDVGLSVAGAVLVSAALFGSIHAYFGVRNVLLKTFDGAVWGLLLIGTSSLLGPFISHATFQYFVWRRLNRRSVLMTGSRATAGSP